MQRMFRPLLALVMMMSAGNVWASGITINVYPALAPNAFGSPSFATWQANAVTAMQNSGASTGTAGTPSYFETTSNVTSDQVVVTGFNSWLGQADPGTVFGAAYASELGNRMTFPLHIDGGGELFAIAELGFSATSTDPFNALAFNFAPGSYNYSAGYQGLNYGTDGTKGTPDDYWVTGGGSTQLVNELYGRGSGNSFAAYCPICSLADQQAEIDATAAYPGNPFSFVGMYYLLSRDHQYSIATGSGTFNIGTPGEQAAPVPEPASMLLLGTGLLGTAWRARRKKSSVA